jgi:Tfp pilus assembly protein PilN
VRAVNLIPAEQRRGAGGIAGRSGGIVYVLTGALAVVVILGVVYALAVHNVADNKGELASVTEQVTAVNAQSQALAPYVSFAGVTSTNVGQVTTLARQRFDWPSAMQQLALALPQDVTFTSFSGTSSAGVAGAVTPSTAAATPAVTGAGASFTITGCATTQGEIATVLENLASVPGVTNVSLNSTIENSKPKKHSAGSSLAVGSTCPYVTFNLALSYAGAYTVQDGNGSADSGSGEQTAASSGSSTITAAGSQQSTGASQ